MSERLKSRWAGRGRERERKREREREEEGEREQEGETLKGEFGWVFAPSPPDNLSAENLTNRQTDWPTDKFVLRARWPRPWWLSKQQLGAEREMQRQSGRGESEIKRTLRSWEREREREGDGGKMCVSISSCLSVMKQSCAFGDS